MDLEGRLADGKLMCERDIPARVALVLDFSSASEGLRVFETATLRMEIESSLIPSEKHPHPCLPTKTLARTGTMIPNGRTTIATCSTLIGMPAVKFCAQRRR